MGSRVESLPTLLADLAPEAELPPNVRGRLLSSRDVALLFNVSARTVTSWAVDGRLPSVRTPGGHHRFRVQAVRDLLSAASVEAASRRPASLPRPADARWSRPSTDADLRVRRAPVPPQ